MTSRDALEKEANDHAMEHALRTLYHKTSKRDDFVAGYLQAAIARDKEIAELRARVKELEGMVPRPCSECGGVGVVETYRAEHASGCTDTRCMSSCPQPVQVMVPCDCCGGNGAIMVPTIHKGGL